MSDTNSESSVAGELTSYTCPGELYSIPRSIHLARLAAFYPKCRECVHRLDSGHVFPRAEQKLRSANQPAPRTSLLTDENVRGVYLNELTRNRALLWGEAVAAFLWDQQPMIAIPKPVDTGQIVENPTIVKPPLISRGPIVVVGFDERPSSPDIVTGIVLGLRRMGCPVVDLGQTALPIVAFHVDSLKASAGLFVSGAGCDPSWTGFDFVTQGARPLPHADLLRLEQFVKTGVLRQTRQIGVHQPRQGLQSYEATLTSFVHALRPLRLVCGSSTRLVPRVLDRLFAKLPCELIHVALPTRRRNLYDVRDVDLQRVAAAVLESRSHLGVVIDEDGQHAAFVTDRGRLVRPREVARLLIEIALREDYAARFVVATSWFEDVGRWLIGRDGVAFDGGETSAELVRHLFEHEAALALSGDGRVWFRHAYPACDALLVLAHLLQALSLSDAPFSEVVTRIV